MRSHLILAAVIFLLTISAPLVRCYPLRTTVTPSLAAVQASEDESAYKIWYETNAAKDYTRAIDLADAYLKKFPSGKYSDYLNKWINSLFIIDFKFRKAIEAKNRDETLRLGKRLIADPGLKEEARFDYLWFLTNDLLQNELFAQPANYSHVADTSAFVQQLLVFIKAGNKPTNATGIWKQNTVISYLSYGLAVIEEHNKNLAKALALYDEASSSDETNVTASFACGRLHYNMYGTASEEFRNLPEAERVAVLENKPDATPAAKAIHQRVITEADAVIGCWARYLGSTMGTNTTTRSQVEQAVKELYKYRHPESTDTVQQIIDKYKRENKPQP